MCGGGSAGLAGAGGAGHLFPHQEGKKAKKAWNKLSSSIRARATAKMAACCDASSAVRAFLFFAPPSLRSLRCLAEGDARGPARRVPDERVGGPRREGAVPKAMVHCGWQSSGGCARRGDVCECFLEARR